MSKPAICSWSGGKDSCLALYRAIQAGFTPLGLLTMMTEGGERSRSHGVHLSVLREQARLLGQRLYTAAASWADYEAHFIACLRGAGHGRNYFICGDIDIEEHRAWEERVARAAGLEALLPLWGEERHALVRAFLGAGFRAIIIAAKERSADGRFLGERFLGRELTPSLVDEIAGTGADPCGEFGEYHTLVIDGPLFDRPLAFESGAVVFRDGYGFFDVRLKE